MILLFLTFIRTVVDLRMSQSKTENSEKKKAQENCLLNHFIDRRGFVRPPDNSEYNIPWNSTILGVWMVLEVLHYLFLQFHQLRAN